MEVGTKDETESKDEAARTAAARIVVADWNFMFGCSLFKGQGCLFSEVTRQLCSTPLDVLDVSVFQDEMCVAASSCRSQNFVVGTLLT